MAVRFEKTDMDSGFPVWQEDETKWFSLLDQKIRQILTEQFANMSKLDSAFAELVGIVTKEVNSNCELLQRSLLFIGFEMNKHVVTVLTPRQTLIGPLHTVQKEIVNGRRSAEKSTLLGIYANEGLMNVLPLFIAKPPPLWCASSEEISNFLSRLRCEIRRILLHLRKSPYCGNVPESYQSTELRNRAREMMKHPEEMAELLQKAVDVTLIESFQQLFPGNECSFDSSLPAAHHARIIREKLLPERSLPSVIMLSGDNIFCFPPEFCVVSLESITFARTKIATLPPSVENMKSLTSLSIFTPSAMFEFPLAMRSLPKGLLLSVDENLRKKLELFVSQHNRQACVTMELE